MNIENKVVVVTGAASGIGRALAQAFKNARADKVYIADLNEEGLAETADLMDGIAIKTDVSKESEIKSLIEKVNNEYENYSKSLKWQLIENKVLSLYKIAVSELEAKDKAKELIRTQMIQYGTKDPDVKEIERFSENILSNKV